jgi:hypothetical protein
MAIATNMGLDQIQDAEDLSPEQIKAQLASDRRMNLLQRLQYRHPQHMANATKWEKYYQLYESEDLYSYLRRHPRESDDTFDSRVKRAYCFNYCKSVVDLFVAYMFNSPIDRNYDVDGGNQTVYRDLMEEIKLDADMSGTSYASFMHDVATHAQVYGHVGVLIDAPQEPDGIISEADRKSAGIRPYLTIIPADQILDWDCDRFGRFNWVLLQVAPDEGRGFSEKEDDATEHFLYWDRKGWRRFRLIANKIAEEVASGASPPGVRGQVPLVIFRNERSLKHPWFGTSALREIADINIAIMNWCSFGDEEIANRCLNILAMERDPNGDQIPTLSHHNILEYPVGGKPPLYLAPGETPLKLIGEWVERGKDEIYRLAKLGGSTGLLGVREATSGIAYAYEFNETNQSLGKKAEAMERGELQVHNFIAAWQNAKFSGTISYPREFGVEDFLMELEILLKSRSALTTESGIKTIEKRLCRKMFSQESIEFRQKVEKEIESSPASEPYPGYVEDFGAVPSKQEEPSQPSDNGKETSDETD